MAPEKINSSYTYFKWNSWLLSVKMEESPIQLSEAFHWKGGLFNIGRGKSHFMIKLSSSSQNSELSKPGADCACVGLRTRSYVALTDWSPNYLQSQKSQMWVRVSMSTEREHSQALKSGRSLEVMKRQIEMALVWLCYI